MTGPAPHVFGLVPEHGDSFELFIETTAEGRCRLVSQEQTERGPRRSDLAEVPADLWRQIGVRVARELAQGMQEAERKGTRAPGFKAGTNRFSPMIGRELAVLLWTLQEDGAAGQLEAILHGWRELAREERWWLYAKAGAPGQRMGIGWRRALFHALSEAVETRAAALPAEKKARRHWIAPSHPAAPAARSGSKPVAPDRQTQASPSQEEGRQWQRRQPPTDPLLT